MLKLLLRDSAATKSSAFYYVVHLQLSRVASIEILQQLGLCWVDSWHDYGGSGSFYDIICICFRLSLFVVFCASKNIVSRQKSDLDSKEWRLA